MARNAAVDRLRTLYASEIPDSPAIDGTAWRTDVDMLTAAQVKEDVRQAVRQLPLRQQQVIVLRYLRDFTVAETAEILGIAEGTVSATTTSAKRRLK